MVIRFRAIDELGAETATDYTLNVPFYISGDLQLVYDATNSDINAGIPLTSDIRLTVSGLTDVRGLPIRPVVGADGKPLKYIGPDGAPQWKVVATPGSSADVPIVEIYLAGQLATVLYLGSEPIAPS